MKSARHGFAMSAVAEALGELSTVLSLESLSCTSRINHTRAPALLSFDEPSWNTGGLVLIVSQRSRNCDTLLSTTFANKELW